MKQQRQLIHKSLRTHKRTAKTAMSCLMLLLLYGCANQGQTVPAVTVLSDEADPSDPENSNVFQQENVAQGSP